MITMNNLFIDLYFFIVIFIIAYPLITSTLWESSSIFYKFHWENHTDTTYAAFTPSVSILIPAYNEGNKIAKCLQALLNINYEDYEIVVINDGSTDHTLQECLPFLDNPKIRLINKKTNQGKAMALNDALPCLNGEIIVTIDADSETDPDFLKHLVWHFRFLKVGSVTGHPRVKNVVNLLSRIQVVEFASIIGLLRRSQTIWGRLMTVSGILAAFRREALYDVNGFHPDMYTEDIDITWRLQKNGWRVHYEPRSIIWMDVPTTFHDFFKQRLRWARGLLQVLKRHVAVITHWKYRKMWAVYIESCLSTTWCVLYGVVFCTESSRLIYDQVGGEFLVAPLHWTFVLFTATLIQLFLGIFMEYKYDRDVIKFAPYIILYPLFYWTFMVLVTLAALPILFIKGGKKVIWSSVRK